MGITARVTRTALRKGMFEGSRGWLVLGLTGLALRLAGRLVRSSPEVVFETKLKARPSIRGNLPTDAKKGLGTGGTDVGADVIFTSLLPLKFVLHSTIAYTATSDVNLVSGGTRIACPCDWNHSGAVTVQDVFDYLTSYFGNAGDFNHDQATTLQDIFDFLGCFFERPFGC